MKTYAGGGGGGGWNPPNPTSFPGDVSLGSGSIAVDRQFRSISGPYAAIGLTIPLINTAIGNYSDAQMASASAPSHGGTGLYVTSDYHWWVWSGAAWKMLVELP